MQLRRRSAQNAAQVVVHGRFPGGTNIQLALREVAKAAGVLRIDHRKECGGIWDLHNLVGGSIARGFVRVSCHRCGLTILDLRQWANTDYEAFCQALDPDGIQRAMLDAADLPPWKP